MSLWSAEDGGPTRQQICPAPGGLHISDSEQLRVAALRDAFATTMVILREPDELFALRHTSAGVP